MKISTCEVMISGTRKVGSKLNGNSRNGAIDCQSFNPNLKAEKATKMMSIKPKAFQRSKMVRERRNAGMKRIIPAINATAMSPIPPGTAKLRAIGRAGKEIQNKSQRIA